LTTLFITFGHHIISAKDMLHREAFRQKRGDSKAQQQPPPVAEENKTAEETVKDSRCPLPPNIENDLRAITKQAGLTHCEQLEKFVVQGIEFKKLENECAQLQANGIQNDKCKYVSSPK
jgi:hypothetical protein